MNDTLKAWEDEAKDFQYSYGKNIFEARDKERILILLEVVRKQQEALESVMNWVVNPPPKYTNEEQTAEEIIQWILKGKTPLDKCEKALAECEKILKG